MGEIPAKLFFRIGEVAGLVGVEPHVLRYWEREFRSIRPTKSAKGQRVYSRRDVENLLRVRDLLYRDGFTIAGAKKKLRDPDDEGSEVAPESAPRSLDADSVASGDAQHELDPTNESQTTQAPVSALMSSATSAPPSSRDKLVALRSEVQAFLAELAPHRDPSNES